MGHYAQAGPDETRGARSDSPHPERAQPAELARSRSERLTRSRRAAPHAAAGAAGSGATDFVALAVGGRGDQIKRAANTEVSVFVPVAWSYSSFFLFFFSH